MAQGLGFFDFLEQLLPAQLELLIGGKFRDQVVVVGIKPLGHLLGVSPATTAVATLVCNCTTGHAKQGVQGRLAGVRAKAFRDHAERQRVGQHLVVPGEVADRQQIDTCILLQLPVGRTQLAANRLQASLVQLALPVGLQGFFQFTVATDTGETQGMRQGHVKTLQQINKMAPFSTDPLRETNSIYSP